MLLIQILLCMIQTLVEIDLLLFCLANVGLFLKKKNNFMSVFRGTQREKKLGKRLGMQFLLSPIVL